MWEGKLEKKLVSCGEMRRSYNIRSILDYLLWWVGPRIEFFNLLKRVFGKSFKVKKRNCFLKGVRKEMLLKAVALSVPIYSMSYFLLLTGFCAELEGFMSFWWGQKREKRMIHWMSWGRMCERKSKGSLGFKDLRIFNLAYLPNKVRDCFKMKILCFINCLK